MFKNRFWMMCVSSAAALLVSGCGQTGPLYMPTIPSAPTPSSAEINAGVTPAATPINKEDTSVSQKK